MASSASSALVLYEPPACTPLTTPTRVFDMPRSGRIEISQAWREGGARTGSAVWDAGVVLAHYVDEHCSRWRNMSSLELGAGLGLASIVASRCGLAHVLATDGDEAVLPMLRKNVAAAASATASASSSSSSSSSRRDDALPPVNVSVAHLEWSDASRLDELLSSAQPHQSVPDLVLASDVVYVGSSAAWNAFLSLVANLCRRRRIAAARSPWLPPVPRHDGTASTAGDPLILLSHTRRYAEEDTHFFRLARRHRFERVALPDAALHPTWRGGRSALYELRWRGDAER